MPAPAPIINATGLGEWHGSGRKCPKRCPTRSISFCFVRDARSKVTEQNDEGNLSGGVQVSS